MDNKITFVDLSENKKLSVGHRIIRNISKKKKVNKILFVAPPDMHEENFNLSRAKNYNYNNFAPYGVGMLASTLIEKGYEVDILNLNHLILKKAYHFSGNIFPFDKIWEDELKKKISEFNPDFIGLTCMFSQTHVALQLVTKKIRELLPDSLISIGGVHVSNALADIITAKTLISELYEADFFFLYEGDNVFLEFINFLNNFSDKEYKPAQLFVKNLNTVYCFKNKNIPSVQEISLPPRHDLLDTGELSKYGKIGAFYCHLPKGTKITTVLSNRGCRAQCTFCSVRNFNGVGVRRRTVKSVVDELQYLKEEFGIGHIMWLDDDFLYSKKDSLALFNEMTRRNLGITWDCSNGIIAAAATEELIAAANDSGCIGLNIGMESGNPDILRSVKKPGAVKNFIKAAEIVKKFPKINSRVFLMIGFPNETYKQLNDTIEVAQEMNLDWYNVTILQPLPNTPIFDQLVKEEFIDKDNIDFTEIRYNSSGYGKHKILKEEPDLLARNFVGAFNVDNYDKVPKKNQLDDIWAYMNYHLNFARLSNENIPIKLNQKMQYVQNIIDTVAPENAFAYYFLAKLHIKKSGTYPLEIKETLVNYLKDSKYWSKRFYDFNLKIADLDKDSNLKIAN